MRQHEDAEWLIDFIDTKVDVAKEVQKKLSKLSKELQSRGIHIVDCHHKFLNATLELPSLEFSNTSVRNMRNVLLQYIRERFPAFEQAWFILLKPKATAFETTYYSRKVDKLKFMFSVFDSPDADQLEMDHRRIVNLVNVQVRAEKQT